MYSVTINARGVNLDTSSTITTLLKNLLEDIKCQRLEIIVEEDSEQR